MITVQTFQTASMVYKMNKSQIFVFSCFATDHNQETKHDTCDS